MHIFSVKLFKLHIRWLSGGVGGGGPSFPDTDRRPASLHPVKRKQSGERLHGDSLGIVSFGAASEAGGVQYSGHISQIS